MGASKELKSSIGEAHNKTWRNAVRFGKGGKGLRLRRPQRSVPCVPSVPLQHKTECSREASCDCGFWDVWVCSTKGQVRTGGRDLWSEKGLGSTKSCDGMKGFGGKYLHRESSFRGDGSGNSWAQSFYSCNYLVSTPAGLILPK